jgi:hypothetical protein
VLLTNNAEGGADGVTVTTGNSGGASGNAWDAVTIGTGATVTYDNDHAHGGSLAYKFLSGSTRTDVNWTSASVGTETEVWGRLYLWLVANPAAELALLRVRSGASQCARLALTTSGTIVIRNAANGVAGTQTNAVATGQWVRVEFRVLASTTVGQIDVRLYNSAESATPTESTALTGLVLTASLNEINWGPVGGTAGETYWLDDLVLNDTGFPGPTAGPSGTGTITGAGSLTSTGTKGGIGAGTAAAVGALPSAGAKGGRGTGTASASAALTAGGDGSSTGSGRTSPPTSTTGARPRSPGAAPPRAGTRTPRPAASP